MISQLTPETVKPNSSEIFRWFNKAMAAARKDKLNEQRVKNSLGWLQRKERNEYETTLQNCTCPDHAKHAEFACKHMVALMILVRIIEERKGKELQQATAAKPASGKHWVEHSANEIAYAEQYTKRLWIEHLFATQDQIAAYKKDYPESSLIPTAQAQGKKFRFCDHRAEIV